MSYNLLKIASEEAADYSQYDDTNRVERLSEEPEKDSEEISELIKAVLAAEKEKAEKLRSQKAEIQKALERLQAARERLARKQQKKRLGMKRVRTKRLFKKRTNKTSRHWEKGNLFGL